MREFFFVLYKLGSCLFLSFSIFLLLHYSKYVCAKRGSVYDYGHHRAVKTCWAKQCCGVCVCNTIVRKKELSKVGCVSLDSVVK